MTCSREAAAWLALVQNGRARTGDYVRWVEQAGNAEAAVEREHGLLTGHVIEQAETQIRAWRNDQIELLPLTDGDYPLNLRSIPDRPSLLFITGRLHGTDSRSVAVIGTRQATSEGKDMARAIAAELSDSGYTINSGLAAGIDTVAHAEALARGGRTVAVLGTGLRHFYPRQNSELQRQIASRCAVISQFWPDTPPHRKNFPLRNRVMAGISLATVVVEASARSGARIQARISLECGRPVVLVEPLLRQQWARELAARPGTHVVGSATDVSRLLNRLCAPSLTT